MRQGSPNEMEKKRNKRSVAYVAAQKAAPGMRQGEKKIINNETGPKKKIIQL